MATERRFAVSPPGKAPWLVFVGLALVLPLVLVFALQGGDIGRPIAPMHLGLLLGALLLFALPVGLALRRRAVLLAGDTLVIKATLYTQRLPVASLDLDASAIVDLQARRELAPRLKTNGVGLPGLLAGHFVRTGEHGGALPRQRQFVLLTDRRRVLRLVERDGRELLLSLERPQALLDALRTAAG